MRTTQGTPILALLCCLFACLPACAPQVTITRVSAAEAFRVRNASILTGTVLSESTLQTLRVRNLDARWERDPKAVLSILIHQHDEQINTSFEPNDLTPAVAELLIAHGEQQARTQLDLTYFLKAAEISYTQMRRDASYLGTSFDGRTAFLTNLYNRAASRFLTLDRWRTLTNSADGRPARYTGFCGDYTTGIRAEDGDWQPGFFDSFESADEVVVDGIRNHHRVDGFGAALVGVREQTQDRATVDPFIPPEGLALPVTVTLDFEPLPGAPTRMTATLHNPRADPHAWLGGVKARLSEDMTAPLAYLFARTKLGQLGQSALPNPNEYVDRIGIYLHEPFDPERIPVLMIHGLRSSPITWRDALNDLGADPELRDRYQFWMFLYPTGLPIPRSSAYLRYAIADLYERYDPERSHEPMRHMVVIGHSMGGVLTRSILIDPGSRVYDAAFTKPIDQLRSDESVKAHLRSVFFYEPVSEIGRAVFIAAPLRGAPLASGVLATIGRGIIRLPDDLRNVGRSLRKNDKDAMAPGFSRLRDGVPTSVHNLEPESPFLMAYDASPLIDIPHHVIVGDRGKGDSEESSDGVVPFWSSRLESARSTLIVPAGHEAHTHPLAIRELARILQEHAREIDAR